MKIHFLHAALGWLFLVTSTQAAVIVAQYDFPASAGTTLPSASTDSDSGSTASSLSVNSALGGSGISSTSGNLANCLFLKGPNNSTEALAFSNTKFITFDVTPTTDGLSYSSLSFDYYRDTTASATSYALYASTGTFTSGSHIAVGTLSGTGVWNSVSLPLSSIPSLQNVTGKETFRMYFWGAGDTGTPTRFDNIVVSVPEPASIVSTGLLGLTLLGVRRRRVA